MTCATCGRAHDATWKPRHTFSRKSTRAEIETVRDEVIAMGVDPEKFTMRILTDRIAAQRHEIALLLKQVEGLKKSFTYALNLANKRAAPQPRAEHEGKAKT